MGEFETAKKKKTKSKGSCSSC